MTKRNTSVLAAILGLALALAPTLAADRQQAGKHYQEGNALLDGNRFKEAAAAFDRAIEQDPEYVEALHNRALANEMVDHAKAIQEWRHFVEIATKREKYKFDVARAQARLQLLESMPPLPEAMHPARYVTEAGDYYWSVSLDSEGDEWPQLPVKVFLGSAPHFKWQEGAREAFDNWRAVFPLELVARQQSADIRVDWEVSLERKGAAGQMAESLAFRRVGDELTARKIAVITVDQRMPWTKDDVRAIISHELGHAFGIIGHSEDKKDIMFLQVQKKGYAIALPGISPTFWRTLVKQPSQRDINTLIRLYNSAGSLARMR